MSDDRMADTMTTTGFSDNSPTGQPPGASVNGHRIGADIDEQVRRIVSALESRVDELAHSVASAVASEVDFYKSSGVVTSDELLASSADNLRFALKGLETAAGFDTSPAVTTGSKRATARVPLPAVMDAYRIASHFLWDAVVQIAATEPDISRAALINATKRIWHLQDAYTDAMTSAYRQQITHQVLEDEAERAALTEALLDGRTLTDYTVWDVAQLLRLPISGPYLVVAAACPAIGKQALPGITAKLRSADIFSAWRLLPDLQIGIAHVATESRRDALVELLKRQAPARVGVSPSFNDLTDTAQALRYARVALNTRNSESRGVAVFEDSLLAVAAVSAPEITDKVAAIILGQFGDLPSGEKGLLFETFRAWIANKGSVPNAAAQLYCHPNTVRHRLRRIEARTGRSIAVPDQLAELCLAFEIRENIRQP
jgi:PucR C-terminal helix-turn-helix domain/GGDEF-like domain